MELTPLNLIPLNIITWSLGCLAFFALGWKSLSRYRQTNNVLTRYFGWFWSVAGLAVLIFALPFFLTLDLGVLRQTYLAGEALLFTALAIQSRIMWHVGLKRYVPYWAVFVPVLIGLGLTWLIDIAAFHPVLLANHIVGVSTPFISCLLLGVTQFLILTPLAFFFGREGFHRQPLKSRLKSLAIGATYAVIALGQFMTDVFNQRTDTPGFCYVSAVIFIGLLVAVALPSQKAKR